MDRIELIRLDVTVEVVEQTGHEGEEGLGVLLGAHGRHLVGLQLGRCRSQPVRPLDRAPHPPLGHHLQHSGLGQQGHMPVQTADGHIAQFVGEFGGRERPVAEKCLDDAEPYRVQQQVRAGHRTSVATIRSYGNILSIASVSHPPTEEMR